MFCEIGILSNDTKRCNKTTTSIRKSYMLNIDSFNKADTQLIYWRSLSIIPSAETEPTNNHKICSYHVNLYLKSYSTRFKLCCNLFNVHAKRSVKTKLQEITLEIAMQTKHLYPDILPGKKLCKSCMDHIKTRSIIPSLQSTSSQLEPEGGELPLPATSSSLT